MDEAIQKLQEWHRSAELFAREALGAQPTPQQVEILNATLKYGFRISVRSGHGTGKSALLSWMILWFLATREECTILCTAPSYNQLFNVLWKEVRKWYNNMSPFMKQQFIITADRISVLGSEATRFALARTVRTDSPDALAGQHSTNMLLIADEASGIPDIIFETGLGTLSTPGACMIMMGNPTKSEGFFYNSQHKNRERWSVHRLSCLDSPLSDKKWIEDMKSDYGEDSQAFRVRVLGEFPLASEDILIPLHWIDEARERDIYPSEPKVAGLDVARFGTDATALVIRHGNVVVYADQWSGQDLMTTVGKVYDKYRDPRDRLFDRINVDVIGIGAGVADRLAEMGVPVGSVNVSESSAMKDRFHRLRDELWWTVRDEFEKKRIALQKDLKFLEAMSGELTEIHYSFPVGKIKIESKDQMRARGKKSPNLADALCLTYAPATTVANPWQKGRRREVQPADMEAWV